MRALRAFASCLAIGTMAMSVAAQPPAQGGQPGGDRPGRAGPGGPGGMQRMMLPPEKAKAAWEAEAKFVSQNLKLNDDQTKAVVKAYADARESESKAMRDMMDKMRQNAQGNEGGRPRMDPDEMQKMREESQKAREDAKAKLESAFKSAKLSPEQSSKAMDVLGSFNAQWDRAVDAITGLNLPAEKQNAAILATQDYVLAMQKARTDANGDRDAMQTAMQEARTKMNDSLKKVLSDEQFEQVQAAFGRGGGMGGGGRRGRGGNGGGEGGGGGGGGGR